jgi:hypothetical protein
MGRQPSREIRWSLGLLCLVSLCIRKLYKALGRVEQGQYSPIQGRSEAAYFALYLSQ